MGITELKNRLSPAPVIGFTGSWRAVEWQPDLFKPQRFVVGVVVESATSGERAFRLMDKANRIECFFSPEPVLNEFAWLMANTRRTLAAGGTLFSHNLTLSDGLFVQGTSIEDTAEELFNEIVSAAVPMPQNGRSDAIGPDTDEVRKDVASELKRIMRLAYESVAREQGETLSNHHLDVTLAPTRGAGSVISACYRTTGTIETKLLRAARDINAYATAQHRDARAIFIQMPDHDARLTTKERADIERTTGEEAWKLECGGFAVSRHTTAQRLAQEIRDWAIPLL